MLGEHVTQGMQVRLRPRGPFRWASAGFLAVWLCGWAVGEVMVLTALALLVASWVIGGPVGPWKENQESGGAIVGGAFMLVWLIGWTFGGVMAIRQLLSLVWAEDRITAASHGLIVERRRGPFRSTREIPRDVLRRIRVLPGTRKLVAETSSEAVEISVLGSADDRDEAANILRDYLGLRSDIESDELTACLPRGWEEAISPEGEVVLVEDPAARRKFARVVAALAVAAGIGATLLVLEALDRPNLWPMAGMVCVATLGLAVVGNRLLRGRMEWRIGSSGLTLRRRHGRRVRDLFEARALELVFSSESDNGRGYALVAMASADPGSGPQSNSTKHRRTIYRTAPDPADAQELARWLASRTGLPFTDRTTREERSAEMARLKQQLSDKGRLGQWAVDSIEYAEARRKS